MVRSGSRPARRAIARWALRLLRREWRQQALVGVLVALVVAGSILFTAGTSSAATATDAATFGTATHRYEAEVAGPADIPAAAAAIADLDVPAEVTATWSRPIAGLADEVELRAADPEGPFSRDLLARRAGRFPVAAAEVALTDDLAAVLGVDLGDVVDLDGTDRRVVGLVEEPADLSADLALVAPTETAAAEEVVVLVGGPGDPPPAELVLGGSRAGTSVSTRSSSTAAAVVAPVVGVTAVALVLVALVAAAGFLALAQRRLRSMGVLASLGATERDLRRVVVANGLAVGVAAATAGAVAGLGAWVVVAARLEEAVGHRIDPSALPWWTVAAPVGLAVVATTGAAWWPARVVAAVPVTQALSGRPPVPRPVHRSAATAAVLVGAGMAALGRGGGQPVLAVAGTIAVAGGVLVVAPVALRTLARLAAPLPVAVRLATRDLGRQQARAGTALAAVSLSLGIPAAVVVASTAAEADRPYANVADDQVLVWTRDGSQPEGVSPYYTEDPHDDGFSPYLPGLDDGQRTAMAAAADRIAEGLDGEAVPLELVTDPAAPVTPDGRLAVTLALPTDDGGALDAAPVFVASDRLLAVYGLEPDDVAPGPDLLSVTDLAARLPGEVRQLLAGDELLLAGTAGRAGPAGPVGDLPRRESSLPAALVTPAGLEERGWEPVVVGWLVDASGPVTPAEVGNARDVAVDAGLLVEPPERRPSLARARWITTGAGTVVALGVLAATIGLLRREGEGDLRTLVAAGATRHTRRLLAATTSGALALLGALLGTAGAYAVLAARDWADLDRLLPVPAVPLLALVLGAPVAAALVSALFVGRRVQPTG
ncbi:MAG TPA: FtsX-like permease family protein [Iamia sp.]|nr:FtsX-like permease family protein [Iamia sp.]